MVLIEALLAGAFIGSVLGFVGAGGAMVSVPILLYIFHFPNEAATIAALVIVGLAATSGVLPKFAQREVLVREAVSIWGIGLVMTISMTALASHINLKVLHSGFALVLVVAGASMLRGPIKANPERRMPIPILILISLIIGTLTGLFGIGGGFLAIPVLVLFYNTPQNKAAGTSLLIIAMNCTTSFLERFKSWHIVDWKTPLTIACVAVIVSRIASTHSGKANAKLLKSSFAYLLFSLSAFTLIKTFLLS
jgi:uncharacterized membrane protein YfcA